MKNKISVYIDNLELPKYENNIVKGNILMDI